MTAILGAILFSLLPSYYSALGLDTSKVCFSGVAIVCTYDQFKQEQMTEDYLKYQREQENLKKEE